MKYHEQKRKVEALENQVDNLNLDYERIQTSRDETVKQLETARVELQLLELQRAIPEVRAKRIEFV